MKLCGVIAMAVRPIALVVTVHCIATHNTRHTCVPSIGHEDGVNLYQSIGRDEARRAWVAHPVRKPAHTHKVVEQNQLGTGKFPIRFDASQAKPSQAKQTNRGDWLSQPSVSFAGNRVQERERRNRRSGWGVVGLPFAYLGTAFGFSAIYSASNSMYSIMM